MHTYILEKQLSLAQNNIYTNLHKPNQKRIISVDNTNKLPSGIESAN